MRVIITGFLGLIVAMSSQAADCVHKMLPDEALQLVKPLMQLRIKQVHEQFTQDGHWKGESQYTPEVDKHFYAILENRTSAGDEATAYLLNVYLGEHEGEELVCELINRGKRMLPLIKRYSTCAPTIGLEPLPKFVRGSGSLAGDAIKGIIKGAQCDYD